MISASDSVFAFCQSIDKKVEEYTENDEAQRQHLGCKPEMKGEIEESESFERALSGNFCCEQQQELKAEDGDSPAGKNCQNRRNFTFHAGGLRPEGVDLILFSGAVHPVFSSWASDFTVVHKMYLLPFCHEFQHVFGAVIAFELISGEVRGEDVQIAGLNSHESGDILPVIFKVGCKEEVCPRAQISAHKLHEVAVYQASLPVTLLGPRVGTVDVESRKRACGDMPGDELPGFDPEDPDIGYAMLLQAAAGLVAPFVVEIDGDKVDVRSVRRTLDNEVTYAAADFEGKRPVIGKDGLPVGGGRKVFAVEKKRRAYFNHSLHKLQSVKKYSLVADKLT